MLSGYTIVHSVAESIRSIENLVEEELGEDSSRVIEHLDIYPTSVKLLKAMHEAPIPSILVAYAGMEMVAIERDHWLWRHDVEVFFRAVDSEDATDARYFRMWSLLINGIPLGSDVKFLNTEIHPDCHSISRGKIDFRRVLANDDFEFDFWRGRSSLYQFGDEDDDE
jgi:hypothetical protein